MGQDPFLFSILQRERQTIIKDQYFQGETFSRIFWPVDSRKQITQLQSVGKVLVAGTGLEREEETGEALCRTVWGKL